MGLFDLFKGGGKGGSERPGKAASVVQKFAETAANKRAQGVERQEALGKLAGLRSVEAVPALLKRFTFHIDPSITDEEEKQIAFHGILDVGAEALEPVRAFAAKAESLSWPMRIVKELVSEDDYVREVIGWLEKWDTEYSKFIDPKLQILAALADHKHSAIRVAAERFLEDVNEPARFHAVAAVFVQEEQASIPALVKALIAEESFRIKNKIVDGFAARSWTVPAPEREAVANALQSEIGRAHV